MPIYDNRTGQTVWSDTDFYVFYNYQESDPDRMPFDAVHKINTTGKERAKANFLKMASFTPSVFVVTKVMTEKEYYYFLMGK